MVHLAQKSMSLVGVLALHMFMVAMVIFALFFVVLFICPDVGQFR